MAKKIPKTIMKKIGQYLHDNHDLRKTNESFLDETAPLVGYIVHCFNSLEQSLNYAICEHINERSDEIGAIIIHKLSYSAKVDLFRRLASSIELEFGKKISCLGLLVDKLQQCGTLRNAIIHADWNHMSEEGYTYVKLDSTANGVFQHYWQFSSESLMDILELLTETIVDFSKYEEEKNNIIND